MTIVAQPIYFKSGPETLFGWLHLPLEHLRVDLGVVICRPFGYESICAHSSICAFADAGAAAGATVLRFDYSGTGDSSGSDAKHDEISRWCADIGAAVAALRLYAGVTRMGLLGVRFGALLASLVAADDRSIDLTIAVAPVVSGRRYLRELKAFHVTSSADFPLAGETLGVTRDPSELDAGLDVAGFRLSQASVDSLAKIDLLRATGRAVPNALILDRSDLPGARLWADGLQARGTDVNYQLLPGLLDMVATPTAAKVPEQMVAAVLAYLMDYRRRLEVPESSVAVALPDGSASMQLSADDGSRLLERALFIDSPRALFAITTNLMHDDALSPTPRRCGVVILNGGTTSHIGPNRMYVDLARSWAARGYYVLRLDLAGIGDSAARPGQSSNEVYPPGALDDVALAIEFLRQEYGVDNVTLAGLCSGAYHALRSATAGLRVDTVLLINPLAFFWKRGSKITDLRDEDVVRNPGIYAERVLSAQSWRKLLDGRVNVGRVLMVFLRRMMLTLGSKIRDLSRKIKIRVGQDLGWELQSLASRGVRIVFLFAKNDAGRELLRLQGGSALNSMGDRCRVHVIEGADHVFSQRPARRKLVQLMTSELPR